MRHQGLRDTRLNANERVLQEHRRHELAVLDKLLREQQRPVPPPPKR